MSKFSELDSDRQIIERLTDVVIPPSFAQTARAGLDYTKEKWEVSLCDDGHWMVHSAGDILAYPGQGDEEQKARSICAVMNAPHITAAHEALASAIERIARLESDLLECREYLEDEVDVVDGDYGQPAPNRAMTLVTMIDETLNGAPQ